MKGIEKLLNRKKGDPYEAYRARVEQERLIKKLPKGTITIEEVNWKLAEIDMRYSRVSDEVELYRPYIRKSYMDAKSLAGTIAKVERVTKKQWYKLVQISFSMLEASFMKA